MNKLYNIINEKHVLKEISKLQPLNYNQFRWWRRFDTPNKPLHKYSALIDKIKNGDYDFSHYYWQAKYAEIEINEIFDNTYPDAALFNEKASLHRARRKRLFEDFEKDEKQKLSQLEKDFYLVKRLFPHLAKNLLFSLHSLMCSKHQTMLLYPH